MIGSMSPARTPHFKRSHIIRLGRLLNMRYTPAEIAAEIGVSTDTVYRSYLPAGCPAERDDQGHIWIVGEEFRSWVQSLLDAKQRAKAQSGCPDPKTAWCFRCKKCVQMLNATPNRVSHYLELMQGECELCGGKVNRARSAVQNREENRD